MVICSEVKMHKNTVQKYLFAQLYAASLWVVCGVFTDVDASPSHAPAAGVYDDYQAVQAGEPSRDLPARLQEYSHHVVGFFRSTEVKLVQLDLHRKQARALGTIFALSDGAQLYLYPRFPTPVQRFSNYKPVQQIGPYLYGRTVSVSAVPHGQTQMSKETMVEVLFDTRTGRFSTLTMATLKDIIAGDEELLAQFESERRKRRKLRLYLQKYMGRNFHPSTDLPTP